MAYRIHTMPDIVDDDGQRPCARGERCASSTMVRQSDGSYERQPARGYRAFCDACRGQVLRAIEQIPGYHKNLRDEMGEKQSGAGPKVSGSRSAPIPVNVTYEALATEIVDLVASWAGRVAVVAGLFGSDSDRRLRAYADEPLKRMSATLAAHVDALLGLDPEPMTRFMTIADAATLPLGTVGRVHPNAGYVEAVLDLGGADAGLEFLELNGRCRWILGLTGKDVDIRVPCPIPSCGLLGFVVRPDGSDGLADYALCRACRTTFVGAQFANLMRDAYEREIARQQAKEAC